tara:strand:+ start:4037 stop:6685 length:2649 start_codon:yes stop_codon:yes gene_type:complete
MSIKDEVETINFQNKYVNGKALEVITDFTHNSYVIKGSTGIGGTTALLNYTKGNMLIVSPNVGMINGKCNGTYASDSQVFIYSKSTKNWTDVNDYLKYTDADKQNLVINCTPNQIVKLRNVNGEFYDQLTNIPIFIDEFHAYTTASDYRNEMGVFLELVFNEWKANFKLSTATPNYLNIDVPTTKGVKYYRLIRGNQQPKQLQISNEGKDVKPFVYNQVAQGRTVVLFTNDINYHKGFKDLRVKNLVGKNLGIKLRPYLRGDEVSPELFKDTDLIILSSSYYAGFDIDIDCSICIVSNQANDAYKVGLNDLVQCYGRPRKKVLDALFVNIKSDYNTIRNEPTYFPKDEREISKALELYQKEYDFYLGIAEGATLYYDVKEHNQITPQLYVNRALLIEPVLNKVLNYQLYNPDLLMRYLTEYGFMVSDYSSSKFELPRLNNSVPFRERLKNLMTYECDVLAKGYNTAKYGLKTKDTGSFNHKLALEYLTVYLLKVTNATELINMLDNARVRPNEYFKTLDLFIRANVNTSRYFEQLSPKQMESGQGLYYDLEASNVLSNSNLTNDWQYLYSCHKVANNILPDTIEREIKLYEIFYNCDVYKPLIDDKNRVRAVKTKILKELVDNGIKLTSDENDWLDEVIKTIFRELKANGGEYTNYNTRKAIKAKMTNALIYLLTDGKVGKVTQTKNREYSALTQTPKALRRIIPIKHLAIDLTAANPQIINSMLDTKIGLDVYQNLMNKRGITRNQAKTLFNSTLNNHKLSITWAKNIYLDCGYNKGDAVKLANLTAQVKKGSFYEVMTANEKILMERYRDVLPFNSYRFHDCIVMSLEAVENYNVTLPTNLQGYIYHVEIFNDSSEYTGRTTNEVYNGGGYVNNYQLLAS